MTIEWHRVDRHRPCAICTKNDWCTYSEIGSCCMRIESERPVRNGGWLHKTDSPIQFVPIRSAKKEIVHSADFGKRSEEWKNHTRDEEIGNLAYSLRLTTDSLKALDCCYSKFHESYAFPMRDGYGNTIGIRLRLRDGRKLSVKGSKSGLFIPMSRVGRLDMSTWLICEGPTDTAAGIALGFFSVGRPSCLGQEQMILDLLSMFARPNIILVYDNDSPGVRGAEKLAAALPRASRFVPPAKDLREFRAQGGTRSLLLSMCGQMRSKAA